MLDDSVGGNHENAWSPMALRKVNLFGCEPDESLDEAGFRHEAASIAERLGAQRINATIYDAFADRPIWPYHYHYSTEEWLFVIAGTPLLRDPGGRRQLRAGDLVRFPPNHRGAHTVHGPGRCIIFATGESAGPWSSVYPDSDKISVSPGLHEHSELNALLLPRSSAVDYWHGEGTANPPLPQSIEREPADGSSLPVVNVHGGRVASPSDSSLRAGLSVTVVELGSGDESAPYHYEHGREEWVVILSGSVTVRHPGGEDLLQAGDVVAFVEGPDGAHHVVNQGDDVARMMLLSTAGAPASLHYPDSGTWVLRNGPDDPPITLRQIDRTDEQDR